MLLIFTMIVTLLQSKITKQVEFVRSVAQVKLLMLVMMKMDDDRLTENRLSVVTSIAQT